MEEIKIVNGKPQPKKKNDPVTLIEVMGYVEVAAGFIAVVLEQTLLGGIFIGIGATHIARNIINHAK